MWQRDQMGDVGRIILTQIFRKQIQAAWTVWAEERDKRQAIVNIVTGFRAPKKCHEFLD